MLSVKEAIIVEGKYDKIKLSGIIDAVIIPTYGFKIFKDKIQLEFFKKLAEDTGIVILTDSDRAGFMIRNHIKNYLMSLSQYNIKHAYIPDIFGKEKRKDKPGKEGKIGVEGISTDILVKALTDAGCTITTSGTTVGDTDGNTDDNSNINNNLSISDFCKISKVTKVNLYEDGLTGRHNSAIIKREFLEFMGLPNKLSTNEMLDVINRLYGYDEYKAILRQFNEKHFD